jgi:Cys-rich protein (TIGR01571 family)
MATGVVVGQPVAAQLVDANGQPYVPLITGHFSSGEFDCCGSKQQKSCLMAWCCPCFTFAGIVTRAQIPAGGNKSMSFNTSLCVWITLIAGIVLCPIIYSIGTTWRRGGDDDAESLAGGGVNVGKEMQMLSYYLACLVFILLFFVWDLRRKFRAKFSIPSSDPADLAWSWCCPCCVLAQMDRHRHLALNDRKCGCSDQGPHPGLAALEAGVQPLQPQAQ